eukprot:scaffold115911_cov36-Cyclotella_meneghiniana.AAC.2
MYPPREQQSWSILFHLPVQIPPSTPAVVKFKYENLDDTPTAPTTKSSKNLQIKIKDATSSSQP